MKEQLLPDLDQQSDANANSIKEFVKKLKSMDQKEFQESIHQEIIPYPKFQSHPRMMQRHRKRQLKLKKKYNLLQKHKKKAAADEAADEESSLEGVGQSAAKMKLSVEKTIVTYLRAKA